MSQPTLRQLIDAVTHAVDDLEQRLRYDPHEYIGSLQEDSAIAVSIRRLTAIRNDDINP